MTLVIAQCNVTLRILDRAALLAATYLGMGSFLVYLVSGHGHPAMLM